MGERSVWNRRHRWNRSNINRSTYQRACTCDRNTYCNTSRSYCNTSVAHRIATHSNPYCNPDPIIVNQGLIFAEIVGLKADIAAASGDRNTYEVNRVKAQATVVQHLKQNRSRSDEAVFRAEQNKIILENIVVLLAFAEQMELSNQAALLSVLGDWSDFFVTWRENDIDLEPLMVEFIAAYEAGLPIGDGTDIEICNQCPIGN